jgi:hypothetical protein
MREPGDRIDDSEWGKRERPSSGFSTERGRCEELESAGARVRGFEWPGGARQPMRARFWSALRGGRFDIGLEEFVSHGRSGRLVPLKDAGALADRLTAPLADAEMRARMGEAGRSLARERFSPEKMVSSIRSVCENVRRDEGARVDLPVAKRTRGVRR